MAILAQIRHRFWNNDGTVAAGGKVYTYEAGTSTPKTSYTDSTGTVANTNPIILNAKGEPQTQAGAPCDIWMSGTYKINALQSDDVQITGYPVDNVGVSTFEWDTPEDSGAVGNGSTDDSVAFSSMVNDAVAGSVIRLTPGKNYKLVGNFTVSKELHFIAWGATVTFPTSAADQGILFSASNIAWEGGTIVGPQHASSVQTQHGIKAYGASSASYLTGIKIRGAKIHNFGGSGIQLLFCENFDVNEWNEVYDCYNYGIIALSSKDGGIVGNHVYDIIGDGVVGTEVYGITTTKNNGTEATYPVCSNIKVTDNIVDGVITWNGIDAHGGSGIKIVDNHVLNCLRPIHCGSYIGTPGDESAPTNCKVDGNTITNDGTVASTDAKQGIIVLGDSASTTPAVGCSVDGNIVVGYGDSDGSVGAVGAIEIQYTDGCSARHNTIRNSGRHALLVSGSTGHMVADNIIDTVSGTAAIAATGAWTFSGNPSDGEAITVNGRVFTYRAAPAGNYEIQIGATQADTVTNTVTQLNGNGSKDGRVYLATYASPDSNTVTITFDTVGRSGNIFSYNESSGVISRAGATLSGGVTGSSAIHVRQLGVVCAGKIQNNVIDAGAYTCIQGDGADHPGVFLEGNRNLGTGPLYDFQGTSAAPNTGAGEIHDMPMVVVDYDPASVGATSSETFYIPYPGVADSQKWQATVGFDKTLDGLTASWVVADNHVRVKLDNPSAGAIDLGVLRAVVKAIRAAATSINLGP